MMVVQGLYWGHIGLCKDCIKSKGIHYIGGCIGLLFPHFGMGRYCWCLHHAPSHDASQQQPAAAEKFMIIAARGVSLKCVSLVPSIFILRSSVQC